MKIKPLLSIVLILRHPSDSIDEVYTALDKNANNEQIEIIIVDGRLNQTELSNLSSDITILTAPGLNMPQLKALGADMSHAKSIAFLEPKGVPTSNWLTVILNQLYNHPLTALTGPVLYEGSGTAFDRAAYLFEYGELSKTRAHGEQARNLAGNNMVLPATSLMTLCGRYIEKNGLNKPFVQQLLINGNVPIRFAPGMVIQLQTDHTASQFLKSRFQYGRCFGGMRCAQSSTIRAWMYRIGAPAIPLLVIYKAWRRAAGSKLLDLTSFLCLTGISLTWSLGEILGYWTGTGNSCERLY